VVDDAERLISALGNNGAVEREKPQEGVFLERAHSPAAVEAVVVPLNGCSGLPADPGRELLDVVVDGVLKLDEARAAEIRQGRVQGKVLLPEEEPPPILQCVSYSSGA